MHAKQQEILERLMLHKDMAAETRKRMKHFKKRKQKVKKRRKPKLYISFNKHAVKNRSK